jgi:hypothetical protein
MLHPIIVVCLVIIGVLLVILLIGFFFYPTGYKTDLSKESTSTSVQDSIISMSESGKIYQEGTCTIDNPDTRVLLDMLVGELPDQGSEQEKIDKVVGGWKQLWSDAVYSVPTGGPCTDSDQVYQVVFPTTDGITDIGSKGFYYNIGKVILNGQVFTDYLRGEYTIQDNGLAIKFTNQFVEPGFPAAGTDLILLANEAELSKENHSAASTATYPVGQTGTLNDVYVDKMLRIALGTGASLSGESLYVLKRTNVIE